MGFDASPHELLEENFPAGLWTVLFFGPSSMDSFGQGILQSCSSRKNTPIQPPTRDADYRIISDMNVKKHAITCSKLGVSIEVCTNLHLQSGSQIPLGNQTCQGKIPDMYFNLFSPIQTTILRGCSHIFAFKPLFLKDFPIFFAFKPLFLKDFLWHFVHSHFGASSPFLFRELFFLGGRSRRNVSRSDSKWRRRMHRCSH